METKEVETKKSAVEEEKKPAAVLNLINIALDTYDDIFSDFDPSPYSTRILSDDFLKEIQKRYSERHKGEFEIRFTIPQAQRNLKTESLIKKRIKDYFSQVLKNTEYELKKKKQKGLLYITIGFSLLALQMYISTYQNNGNFFAKMIEIFLVPAGWYGMFEGIGNLLETPPALESQQRFYTKLKNANYVFISEEEVVKMIAESAAKTELATEIKKTEPKIEEKK
mgnify:CR=1 FL=1